MNKTININLGGLPFVLDDSAFNKLDRYLKAIKSHFTNYESYDEIMNDIEIRVGELLQENIKSRLIVNEADIDQIITIMGRPEDFGAEPMDETEQAQENQQAKRSSDNFTGKKYSTGKKLFRNQNKKMLAGVSAGLAAYFGVNVLLFRILFIVLSFGGGVGIPIYILMWIFVPKAKTSADYLAMRGENASVSNIAEYFEKGFNRFSDEVNSITDDISSKVKDGQYKEKAKGFIQDLEDNLLLAWNKLIKLIHPFFKLIGVILLGIFAFTWVSLMVVLVTALPLIKYISSNSTIINIIASLNSIVVFVIPLVFLVLWALKILFKSTVSNTLKKSLLIFWVSNFICLLVMGGLTANDYRAAYSETGNVPLNINSKNEIRLKISSEDVSDYQVFSFRYGNNGNLIVEQTPALIIKKSEDAQWHLQKKMKSQGQNNEEARQNLNCIEYNISSDSNTISFSDFVTIKKDCKYRVQDVDLILYIPVGATFRFQDDRILWMIRDVEVNKAQMPNGFTYNLKDKLYKMTDDGLSCVDCTQEELNKVIYNGNQDDIDIDDLPADYILQMNEKSENIPIIPDQELTISMDKITATPEGMTRDNIQINIRQSENDKMHIVEKLKYYSRQPLSTDEITNMYKVKLFNNEMVLSNVYLLPAGNMNSVLDVTLFIPDKTKVKFDEKIIQYLTDVTFNPENPHSTDDLNNDTWEMTTTGLKCLSCE